MSRYRGRRVRKQSNTTGRFLLRVVGLSVSATATMVAWVLLVVAAIDFGAEARVGVAIALGLTIAAVIGAAACLSLGVIISVRLWQTVRQYLFEPTLAPPPRVAGRRKR